LRYANLSEIQIFGFVDAFFRGVILIVIGLACYQFN